MPLPLSPNPCSHTTVAVCCPSCASTTLVGPARVPGGEKTGRREGGEVGPERESHFEMPLPLSPSPCSHTTVAVCRPSCASTTLVGPARVPGGEKTGRREGGEVGPERESHFEMPLPLSPSPCSHTTVAVCRPSCASTTLVGPARVPGGTWVTGRREAGEFCPLVSLAQ
ncbi:unnamed protein product [Closterium sp. Naga37s-1]|nr:unnamed protein product [Closterium sp. Naga37s-1]